MPPLLASSPNAILRGGKGNVDQNKDPLLGAPGEHRENEQGPTQLMSEDEGLLARLGYKQGSLFLLSDIPHTDPTVW